MTSADVHGTTNEPTLLLVLPLRSRRVDGEVLFERQASNGLSLWADHFSRVTVACPTMPESILGRFANMSWTPAREIRNVERVKFIDMPHAYDGLAFLRARAKTAARLAALMKQSRYLHFALGGLIGDWGTVAAHVAAKSGRAYSVWTDRVEHEVERRSAAGSWKRRLRSGLIWRPMRNAHRRAIESAALGLFHGRECFDAYAPWCRHPELVHDVHIRAADRLDIEALRAKQARVLDGGPMRVVYAGRAVSMKGPLDWVRAIAGAIGRGADIRGAWLGDGPELSEMKRLAAALNIADRIEFAGFVDDRARVLDALRAADALLFCHKTPESPRILLESLASATPLVGYASAFPVDLIATNGGGRLTPLNDVEALATQLASVAADRGLLASLIESAWQDGEPFNDAAVFAHRSELIKRFS